MCQPQVARKLLIRALVPPKLCDWPANISSSLQIFVGDLPCRLLLDDEIGDLSSEVQSKLLRVSQDWEFEVVGDDKTRRADVRIIAATNRDL